MILKQFVLLFYRALLLLTRYRLGFRKKTVRIDGYKISYFHKSGRGNKALFAIHGLNDTKERWFPFMKHLNPHYPTILIDLLGSGESDAPFNFDYTLQYQADFLEKAIHKIAAIENIKQLTLIGHSMGGGLSILLANRLPIAKLILLAPLSINYHDPFVVSFARKLGDVKKVPFFHVCSRKRLAALSDLLFYKKPDTPAFLLDVIVAQKCKRSMLEEKKILALIDAENFKLYDDLTITAQEITIPTLIVWGEDDKILDPKNASELKKLIPHSELKLYSKCGHMIALEYPAKLANDCKQFLS